MLKLNKPYRYTQAEWQHVSTILIPYVRLHGGQKGWDKADNVTKDLKNRISEFTLIQQECRCAYCEAFIPGGAQLDHFVPKQLHPEFCYEPKNLITSCAVCNMYIKNAGDTIALPAKRRYEPPSAWSIPRLPRFVSSPLPESMWATGWRWADCWAALPLCPSIRNPVKILSPAEAVSPPRCKA